MAAQLRLSRTPVREALNRLASEGFVTLIPNRGFVARGIEVNELVDLHELRAVVESAAFVRMCRRASDREIEELAAFWESVQPAYLTHDSDAILAADEAFHLRIAAASGNVEFTALLEMINARVRFIRRILIDHGRHDAALVDDHARLVAAACARDADEGAATMQAHVALSAEAAQEALKDALLLMHTASRDASSIWS